MIALVLTLLAGSPIEASAVAGDEHGIPPGILFRICRRESWCRAGVVHKLDLKFSATQRRRSIARGWLSADCGDPSENWSSVGPFGTSRAYASRFDDEGCITVDEARDSLHMARIAARWALYGCWRRRNSEVFLRWVSGLNLKNPGQIVRGRSVCRKIRAVTSEVGSVASAVATVRTRAT